MRAIIVACALLLQDQFNKDGQVLAIQLQVTGAMKSQIVARDDLQVVKPKKDDKDEKKKDKDKDDKKDKDKDEKKKDKKDKKDKKKKDKKDKKKTLKYKITRKIKCCSRKDDSSDSSDSD